MYVKHFQKDTLSQGVEFLVVDGIVLESTGFLLPPWCCDGAGCVPRAGESPHGSTGLQGTGVVSGGEMFSTRHGVPKSDITRYPKRRNFFSQIISLFDRSETLATCRT